MDIGIYRKGEIVAERFQLLGEIGSGGMGAVWRARDIVSADVVALKLLHNDAGDYDNARERFLREARALTSLRSPHIVRVLDSGVDAGTPFIAMELLAGESLARRLRRIGRLPVSEVLNLVTQVARGVGAAHDVGIVHRDLKPDNIFVIRENEATVVKILDFGVAKARLSETSVRTLTHSGAIVGTPHYMSPEQIDGVSADWRADLWALAVVTFECLVGVKPFQNTALAKLCLSICDGPLPIPSTFRTVPVGFDAWFKKGVARNREERFQSARELADALSTVLMGATDRPSGSATHLQRQPSLFLLSVAIDDDLRLMQSLGAEYAAVKSRVDSIVTDVMQAHGAMMTEPARTFAFQSAATALNGAIALQQAMNDVAWPRGYLVSLCVGLVDAAEDDVALVHALVEVAHGGQILVAESLGELDALGAASGLKLEDLGQHELLDERREHVFQAVGRGMHPVFAPLKTRGSTPNNLPRETSSFIGRQSDVSSLDRVLQTHRLVTLRGPGGVGKSRLARRVAAVASPRARDGTFLIPLASVRDWHLIVPTIASVIGVAEHGERSTVETLIDHLSSRQVLLVLDNFEHVMPAAADIEMILNGAPDVRALVTSRTALSLAGEHVYDISPFALPRPDACLDELLSNDAVQLLLDRSQRNHPDIKMTREHAPAVAELVRQLDGLPLAIELAAARLGEISAAELSRQLAVRHTRLHDTSGGVGRRHRTLRDVVAWSYDLLSDDARTLLRRLAVFVGGFTLDLAETVVDELALGIEEALETLVGGSLITRQTHGRRERYAMLETVREFALTELEHSGEITDVRRRHAEAMRALVENVAPALKREGSVAARELLALEDGNIRAALDFCLTTGDATLGLAIASSAWRYWQAGGRLHEGRRWLVELLARPSSTLATRARGVEALAGLAYWQADYATATKRYQEALEIFRELGDQLAVGEMLFALSTTATWSGDSRQGEALAGEALAIFEEVGAREHVGMVRMAEGFARWMQRDLAGARSLWEASIAIAREVGDHVEAAHKTLALASITYADGRTADAVGQAIGAMDELFAHHNIALTIMAIDFIASMIVHEQSALATRLSGAATRLRGTMGGGMHPEACGLPSVSSVAIGRLGAQTHRELFEEGTRLDLHQAIALAHVSYGASESEYAEAH